MKQTVGQYCCQYCSFKLPFAGYLILHIKGHNTCCMLKQTLNTHTLCNIAVYIVLTCICILMHIYMYQHFKTSWSCHPITMLGIQILEQRISIVLVVPLVSTYIKVKSAHIDLSAFLLPTLTIYSCPPSVYILQVSTACNNVNNWLW